MIKKINKYLLENHPLIWNTKILWMVLTLLVAHIAFYFAGFFSFSDVKELHGYSLFDKYANNGTIWIGILLSILVFILWLNGYFKQNAFKSFYPKSNRSLFMELVWVFIICFMNISFYISYTEGLRQRVSSSISIEELENEIDLANKAGAFTLQGDYDYRYDNRCVPVLAFDTLVSEEEVLKLYVENIVENASNYHWKDIDSDDYLLHRDSLPQPYYINEEYAKLLIKHFQERIDSIAEVKSEGESDYYYYSGIHLLNSIHNYSKSIFIGDMFQSQETETNYPSYTADLLQNNKKEEIEKILVDYLALADKYKVSYRFKDKKWIDYVYNPPYYFIDYTTLSRVEEYVDATNSYMPLDHIKSEDIAQCLKNLARSKSNVIEIEIVLLFLYLALFFTLLIYLFRITSLRVWLMSFVGAIVTIFIFAAIYFLLNAIIDDYTVEEVMMVYQCFAFMLLFWAIVIYCLRKEKWKKLSGIFLNFGLLTVPAILPLFTARYFIYLEQFYDYSNGVYHHPHYILIKGYIPELFIANVAASFVLLFLLMPVIKKWKALPEE